MEEVPLENKFWLKQKNFKFGENSGYSCLLFESLFSKEKKERSDPHAWYRVKGCVHIKLWHELSTVGFPLKQKESTIGNTSHLLFSEK